VIQLVAVHQSYYIARSEWVDEGGKAHNLDLVEKVVVDYESKRLGESQIRAVKNLRRVVESNDNLHKAAQLFSEIDKDNSGQLDEKEFAHLLDSLGNPNRLSEPSVLVM
jgi:Ca2+-binding EF-hand superfamily protein